MEHRDDRRIDLTVSALGRVVAIERVGDVVEVLLDEVSTALSRMV
jgi:hypothetical protein